MNLQEKQTVKNVRQFFKHDYQSIKQYALLSDIKAINYDAITNKDHLNHQEEKILKIASCHELVETIQAIIDHVQNKDLKFILQECYLNITLNGRLNNNYITVMQLVCLFIVC